VIKKLTRVFYNRDAAEVARDLLLKGSLGLRSNFHQIETRVDGHIFISVIAYHLLRWIGYALEQSGDHRE